MDENRTFLVEVIMKFWDEASTWRIMLICDFLALRLVVIYSSNCWNYATLFKERLTRQKKRKLKFKGKFLPLNQPHSEIFKYDTISEQTHRIPSTWVTFKFLCHSLVVNKCGWAIRGCSGWQSDSMAFKLAHTSWQWTRVFWSLEFWYQGSCSSSAQFSLSICIPIPSINPSGSPTSWTLPLNPNSLHPILILFFLSSPLLHFRHLNPLWVKSKKNFARSSWGQRSQLSKLKSDPWALSLMVRTQQLKTG